MPKIARSTRPKDMAGMAFLDIESFAVISYCPDSRDASTPAKQVHVILDLKQSAGGSNLPPLVMRYHGPGSLDAHIEAMIEHRTYVFGKRKFDTEYPVQPGMPEE